MTSNYQYALVAHGSTPIAEYSLIEGNHRSIAIKMLENIDPKTPNAVVEQGNFIFMTLTESDRMTFLVLTQKSVPASGRISFLQELQRKWRSKYGRSGASFGKYSKNDEFGKNDIAALIRLFNSERNAKLTQAKENIAQAQEQMTQNLTMALARGDQLEVMEKKAENIRESAQQFSREANQVKKKMCWQRYRWYLVAVIAVIVLILVIILIACKGFKCKKSK